MQLLGARTAPQFFSRYWQKRPLVVRNAISGFTDLLPQADLFRLASDDDIESRVVRHDAGRWTLEHGPFALSAFKRIPAANWTLLVQGLNLHNQRADKLLRLFNFIPYARLDDVMVSYAVPGGGVGPHTDSYDVFLLQGSGRRLWRVGRVRNPELLKDAPLRILKHFEPEAEYTMEAGDLLYLPPGWAHDGVAIDTCTTYSIGFRAPGRGELLSEFLLRFSERISEECKFPGLYRDPDLRAQSRPSAIPGAMVDKTAAMLSQLRFTRGDIARFLGEYLSEPKPRIVFSRPRRRVSPAQFAAALGKHGVKLSSRTLMLHSQNAVFINGERLSLQGPIRARLVHLADNRELPAGRYSQPLRQLLHDWYVSGWLQIGSGMSHT